MSKFGKFKDIFKVGSAIAKPFVPGAAGSILDAVTKGLESTGNTASSTSADAIKQLAADNDEQTQAILALHERIKILESK